MKTKQEQGGRILLSFSLKQETKASHLQPGSSTPAERWHVLKPQHSNAKLSFQEKTNCCTYPQISECLQFAGLKCRILWLRLLFFTVKPARLSPHQLATRGCQPVLIRLQNRQALLGNEFVEGRQGSERKRQHYALHFTNAGQSQEEI